ncbi:hypothetical protein CNR22_22375 [Sphingobacteriaceae bacterium]|nr:hypothetical protein CNR22_22375 [Sphingobacteriaceae bacterium]
MTKKLLLMSLLIGSALAVSAQTTVTSKISAALDDHEEKISGPLPVTGTAGDMYSASTALNLGSETATSNPVMVGVRFTNITVPKFATIISAYIQFNVQGTSNVDPCTMSIYAENNVNPATFSDAASNLSSRSLAPGSVSWNVSGTSWSTVGSVTADQKTPDIKSLVTPLVFKSTWAPGNPMAFFFKGPGMRQVYSFEGDPTKVAELTITYSTTGTSTVVTGTGITEMHNTSSVNVYPNPFKSTFNVKVEVETPGDVKISVIDITGKLVEEKNFEQAAMGTLSYTFASHLNSGMYFVKVQANNKQEVIKVISE